MKGRVLPVDTVRVTHNNDRMRIRHNINKKEIFKKPLPNYSGGCLILSHNTLFISGCL